MCFRENNNDGSKREYKSKSAYKSEHVNVINVCQDVNSILYTVTNVHPKAAGILLKSLMFFIVKV